MAAHHASHRRRSQAPLVSPAVEVAVVPEPEPDEREALLAALEQLDEPSSPYESAWRRAGIDPDVDAYVAAPRSSRGATRA